MALHLCPMCVQLPVALCMLLTYTVGVVSRYADHVENWCLYHTLLLLLLLLRLSLLLLLSLLLTPLLLPLLLLPLPVAA